MTTEAALALSFAHCEEIIRRQAHSFYFASFFLPRHKRREVCALYAFYRTVDDLVDRRPDGCSPARIMEELAAWRVWLRNRSDQSQPDPVRMALGTVIDRHALPLQYFDQLLDGVESDLYPCQLQTFCELERYCYRVAGTVGLVMSYVLGVKGDTALANARDLGIAMQLTNILRDIGEDLARGTVYLPADELAQFGYSAERLALRTVDSDFIALMRMQIARARAYYRTGMAGISQLPRDSQFPILLAARMYGGILRKIECGGYDVFSHRPHMQLPEKLWVAGRSYVGLKVAGWAPAPTGALWP